MGALVVVTAPTVEPITLAEARAQCRITHGMDDGLLAGLILEAREWAHSCTRRVLCETTYDYYLHDFERVIRLPVGPVSAITSIQYYDTLNALQTLPEAQYDADLRSLAPMIYQASGYEWPDVYDRTNAVVVRFVAGYADHHPDLLQARQAMLLYIEASYDRDPQSYDMLMQAAERKLSPLRMP